MLGRIVAHASTPWKKSVYSEKQRQTIESNTFCTCQYDLDDRYKPKKQSTAAAADVENNPPIVAVIADATDYAEFFRSDCSFSSSGSPPVGLNSSHAHRTQSKTCISP